MAEPHSYTYIVVVKNITLIVDEDVLAAVRERNSTVNALVREYLAGLAAHEDRAKRPGPLAAIERTVPRPARQE